MTCGGTTVHQYTRRRNTSNKSNKKERKKKRKLSFFHFVADEPLALVSLGVLFFSQLERARKQPLYSSATLSLAGGGVGSNVYKQLPDMTERK